MTAIEALLLALPNLTVLTLGDLRLCLRDICDRQVEAVAQTKSGQVYMPILQTVKVDLEALPEYLVGGLPLADMLAETDARHDDFGAALWFIAEASKRLPSLSDAVLAAILKAQDTFIPNRSDLQHAYKKEAADAIAHRPAFEAQRKALSQIPTPDGRTLADLVDDFLSAGEHIETLLRQRSDESQGTSRAHASSVRVRALSALINFRTILADELRAGLTPASAFESIWKFTHSLAVPRSTPTPTPSPTPPPAV